MDEFEEFEEDVSEEPATVAEVPSEAPAESNEEISDDEFEEFDEELSEDEFDEFDDF